MLKTTTFLLLFFSSIFILAQAEYNMQNATVTDCSGILYDSGGENEMYGPNEDFTFTICPDPTPVCMHIDFRVVQMESYYENLEVYDGSDTNGTLLLFHNDGIERITPLKAYSGCITIKFTSDYEAELQGWKATWNCFAEDCPPIVNRPNEQDCEGALVICQEISTNKFAYLGEGNVLNEISDSHSCLLSGEKNSVWHKLNVNENGDLAFSIIPNKLDDDYDWAVFNITDTPCSQIRNNSSLLVSCNYSSDLGITGATGATNQTTAGGEANNQNAKIPVKEGEIYAINISQFSVSENGFTIDFSDSSIPIGDTSPPIIENYNTFLKGSDSDVLQLNFSDDILCKTIEDLNLSIEGYELIYDTPCNETGYAQTFLFRIEPELEIDDYEVLLEGEIADACGNTATVNESFDLQIADLTDIEDVLQNPIHLYPNPSQHTIFVELPFTSMPKNTLIEVYDLTGQKLQSTHTINQQNAEIDVSDYPKGIYYLKVKIGERTWVEKVTIQ